ncbi:hypothetical protein ACE1CD_30255 [Aerosakkonema sp. BLCC-F183]|uniref:hypothetical protein n=1 Tax=Aerosakkonema sp. BLCC-F183 TaxID=3342834 RepID=UPI0035B71D5D
MIKVKLALAAIASSAAIASGILLSSVNSAEACSFYKQKYQAKSWLNTPWAFVITLPGIALATALYMGGRSYQNEPQ